MEKNVSKTYGMRITIDGHVNIRDDLGKVYLDKHNAIHNKNMADTIAYGLSNLSASNPNFAIAQVQFGNGGVVSDSSNALVFKSPNVTGTNAGLYNQTYAESVTTAGNTVSADTSDPLTSSIITTITISADEPAGQDTTDNDTNLDSQFSFDELGLFTADGKLLTHIIFSPILKTANRELILTYTLTVTVE